MNIQKQQYLNNVRGIGYDIATTNNYDYVAEQSAGGISGDPMTWLNRIMNNFGQPCNHEWCGDYNGDGVVDIQDLLDLLNDWPQPPPEDPQGAQAPIGGRFSTRRGFNPSSLYRENTQIATTNNYDYVAEQSAGGMSGDPRTILAAIMDNFGGNCSWGQGCGDYNGDGVVDVQDILDLLDDWPQLPPEDPQGAQAPIGGRFSTSAQQRRGFNPSSLYRENTQLDESKLTLQEQKAGLDPEMLKQMVSKMGGAGKMGGMPKMGNGNGEMPPMPKMGNGNGKGMPKLDPEMIKKLMAMMGKMGG